MQITFKNSFVEICVELEPFFRIDSFTDLKTGKNMLSTGTPKFVADREVLADYKLIGTNRRAGTSPGKTVPSL